MSRSRRLPEHLVVGLQRWALLAVSLALSACGGAVSELGNRSGSVTQGATTTTGFFRDSNVSGLNYQSEEITGVTEKTGEGIVQGSFTYVDGNQITFAVGGVTLGTARAARFMTPISLISNGTILSDSVVNMTRFLMMLDEDNDPSNGIAISEGVQTIAANWAQVDFGSITFAADLAGIISDVASTDGRAPVLPNAATAQTHLNNTMLCSYTGAFYGTYVNSSNTTIGRIAFIIDPHTGMVSGYLYRLSDGSVFPLTGTTPLAFTADINSGVEMVATTPATDEVTLSFSTFSDIVGTWTTQAQGGQSGTVTATRIDTSQTATYRYVGLHRGSEFGVLSFGLYGDGVDNINGEIYTMSTDNSLSITGSLQNTTDTRLIDASTADAKTVAGTLTLSTGVMSGQWSSAIDAAQTGTFSGTGCRLN